MENISKRVFLTGLAMQKLIELFPSRKEVDVAICAMKYAEAMLNELDKEGK